MIYMMLLRPRECVCGKCVVAIFVGRSVDLLFIDYYESQLGGLN